MQILAALVAGLVFGIGLIVSGMANPAKVLGFLDLAGPWDPSLALVMAGAIAVGLPAFALAKRRTTSLLGTPLNLPRNADWFEATKELRKAFIQHTPDEIQESLGRRPGGKVAATAS